MSDLLGALADALGVEEQDRLYGLGAPQVAVVPNPLVGTDWAFTPSTTRAAKVVSISARLTSSAVAGNRNPIMAITSPSGSIVAQMAANNNQAAGGMALWSWVDGMTTLQVAPAAFMNPYRALWLPPGSTVKVTTNALDVADQWSSIAALVELR